VQVGALDVREEPLSFLIGNHRQGQSAQDALQNFRGGARVKVVARTCWAASGSHPAAVAGAPWR